MARTQSQLDYDAVIVGAGHNGLVCAFYLARAGLRVGIFETLDHVGGACITQEVVPGHLFSTCAGVCWKLQHKIVEDMELGRRGLRLLPLDPGKVVLHPDGTSLVRWNDDARTAAEISRFNGEDSISFGRWQETWRQGADVAHAFFLKDPPTLDDLRTYAEANRESEVFERLLQTSIAAICMEHFSDPRVQGSLVSVDDVIDPWAPGSAWIETYFHQEGSISAFVKGGMGRVTATMAEAAREAGADIHLGINIDRLLVDDRGVAGVELADGREVRALVVISNADPKRLVREHLSDVAPASAFVAAVQSLSTRAAPLKFHGVMRRPPKISHYFGKRSVPSIGQLALGPTLERFGRARDDVLARRPVRDPVVYLHLPSAFDPSLAPAPSQCISAYIRYAPVSLASGSWSDQKPQVARNLIDSITEFIPNFRRDLSDWVLFTPEDIEARVGLTDGNIHHTDHVAGQFLGDRQVMGLGYRTPIDGLYMCGAGTHPGGEVTGAPGHNAAHAVLRDLAQRSLNAVTRP